MLQEMLHGAKIAEKYKEFPYRVWVRIPSSALKLVGLNKKQPMAKTRN
jgi:hypothetical protein